jgi:aminoglycoside phosphotransferase (APT) family kinase protein
MTTAMTTAMTGTPRDRLTGEALLALRELPSFRGATVVEAVPLRRDGRIVRLRFDDGSRVVVKSATPRAPGSVAHEAAVLAQLHPIGLPVPRPITTLSGSASTVLITEDLPCREPLDHRRHQAGGTSPQWAAAAGAALGRVHEARRCGVPERLPRTEPARRLLQAWTVVTPRDVALHGDGFAELVRQLRRTDLLDVLEEVAGCWTPGALVHGDVTFADLLCAADPEQDRPVSVVRWETAGRGDPRWDVGCLIAEFLWSWLGRAELVADEGLDAWTVPADPPFGAVREEICAAVDGYAAERAVSPGDRRQWIRFAGFALVRRVFAAALTCPALPPRALDHLQMAGQLLRRPELSGEMLLCP